jgi:hypothetical protein
VRGPDDIVDLAAGSTDSKYSGKPNFSPEFITSPQACWPSQPNSAAERINCKFTIVFASVEYDDTVPLDDPCPCKQCRVACTESGPAFRRGSSSPEPVKPQDSFMRANLFLTVASMMVAPLILPAQYSTSEDRSELGAYFGGGTGAGTNHVWVGGTTGVSPSKYFMAILDTSFMPLGSNTLRKGLVGTSNSRLYDFNFGGHILIPVHHHHAITPYGVLACGVLYNTYRIAAVRPDGFAYLAGRSDAKFGFETGGGMRYMVTEGFGVRGEYRFTASTQNFHRVLFGVFYQFDGMWPFRARTKSVTLPR